MKIGVSGASGHVGRAVVSELLQRAGGHVVVAITRTPETVSELAQGRLGATTGPKTLRTPMRVSIACSSSRPSIPNSESAGAARLPWQLVDCRPTGNYLQIMWLWGKRVFPKCLQVKALSPHHRFVIALHSLDGVAETGLCVCRPEKNARKPGRRVRWRTFSSAV